MTKEEMRIAIAEHLGWIKVKELKWARARLDPPKQFMPGCNHTPNWPEDLNACHEMEKSLNVNQRDFYVDLLCETDYSCFADSMQRCEMFLKTVGKWKG